MKAAFYIRGGHGVEAAFYIRGGHGVEATAVYSTSGEAMGWT